MAHFCGFIKLIFLLLMLARIPSNETRPLKGNSQANSDLIAGNEFLKLFMEHDQLDKDFYSSEYVGGGSGGGNAGAERRKSVAAATKKEESYDKKSAETGRRSSSGRSLKDKGPKLNQAEGQLEDSKQVVKLVTSGSKIVFLEDYDENDAILDAEARDIDLKREIFKQKTHPNLDDYKVVAVSVSSSSQRGTTTARNRFAHKATSAKYEKRPTTTVKTTSTTTTTTSKAFVTMTPKPPAATTVRSQTSPASAPASSTKIDATAGDNFINRSHKSEFSIEEVEPLTMTQQQKSRKIHSRHRTYPVVTSVSDTLEALDSENSASTNIHNVLVAPLQPSASARSTSMVTTTYHSGQRNMTINHDSNLHVAQARHKTATTTTTNTDDDKPKAGDLQQHMTSGSGGGGAVDDQLLPFQTVIYHDTKAGHGPQSRSISYSSISQNVEDLKKWQQSGILAEARRNVSESLKPIPRSNVSSSNHQQEPAKFYSQPSKMYSEPAKFYSEPSKVYSEPAKVYGEPEKFYSEPAKVYGQPSKFYSEPSKVYSQPAKVYSEPAKTYWPILTATTTTSTNTGSTIIPPTNAPTITTIPPTPHSVNIHQSSRKPAIVSRIAFGEAHLTSSTSTSTTSTTTTTTTTPAPLTTTSRTYGSHSQHQYSRTYSSHRNPSSTSLNNENSSSSSSSSTPSRRILFNLDRLPYDLLNAPEPSIQQQQLLELQKTKRPQQTLTYPQSKQQQQHQQPQQQQQRHNINPCLESAVSSLFSSSSLSVHPALLKQRQQHSSLSDQQQHSNQNAKGLPNGDLVKCVAEISHTSSAAAAASHDDDNDDTSGGVEAFTTERSHIEELFTPTPEQNYEIEESVSVMTNGRAHSGGRNSLAQPTTSPIHTQQHHGFKPNRQRTRIHFGTNVNNPEVHDGGHQLSQTSYNTNANANANTNKNRHHTAPDYSQYDEASHNGDGGGGEDDSTDDDAAKNNDYDDTGSPANENDDDGNNGGGGGDGDDSKVAYIVEGHNYRKYRVEEETDDGFIVGEYGVVDHNDGNLRGVRYTADSTINRSLIQKALLTFLKLK
ncbi:mucin-2 [Calliphora vicina]|uniref:mucin-2 n=1 Tax=Calliphora vicina TaxID=7373 RepID=UPI00325BAFAA